MSTYCNMIEDRAGDIVDIEWFDSATCFEAHTGRSAYGFAYPGGSETDYDMHCAHCGELMWHGLEVSA